MLANFLLTEGQRREDGESGPLAVGSAKSKLVILTLGITSIIEQESLDVSVWVSKDAQDWSAKPAAAFPQKFYCGTYTILVDLAEHPDAEHLKVRWKMSRWGRGDPKPSFGFYVFAQESGVQTMAGAGV